MNRTYTRRRLRNQNRKLRSDNAALRLLVAALTAINVLLVIQHAASYILTH